MKADQLNLFDVPGAPVAPGRSARAGGAAGRLSQFIVELPAPNPAGRRRLRFEFRADARWSDAQRVAACELLGLYFREVSGFSRATTAVVSAWCRVLASGVFSPEQLAAAIRAKADSLRAGMGTGRRAKRRYVGSPRTFLRRAGYWLRCAGVLPAAPIGISGRITDRLNSLCAARTAVQADSRDATRRMDSERAPWALLSRAQRQLAIAAVLPTFKERCRTWSEDPHSPTMRGLLLSWGLDFARRLWPSVTPRAAGAAATVSLFDPPPTPAVPSVFGAAPT